jgi:hypothetical protein
MPITSQTPQKNLSNLGGTIWAILGITLLAVWLAVIWGLKSLHQDAIGNQFQESNNIARSNSAASEQITATVMELSKIADSTHREVEKFRL